LAPFQPSPNVSFRINLTHKGANNCAGTGVEAIIGAREGDKEGTIEGTEIGFEVGDMVRFVTIRVGE